ncbi:MAG: DNA-binding protein [Bacteroidetes bacterium B1(2017)]|nr:MAG: DNA-binding protein [Bacteroidetes bacterium B1(2017)]
MKNILFSISLIWLVFACGESTPSTKLDPNIHKGIALEKINATQYTYVLVNENGVEKWLACPLTEIVIGEPYYYMNEMLMTNFASKDLGRTFDKVYFVGGVSLEVPKLVEPGQVTNMNPEPVPQGQPHVGSAVVEKVKLPVDIAPAKGQITIATLYEKKESLAGKKVLVKGKVAKFSAEIMDKNWIHIQDGTEFKGDFDLTLTTKETVAVGDVVTFEGTVAVNKDFGAGYTYSLILEDVVIKK